MVKTWLAKQQFQRQLKQLKRSRIADWYSPPEITSPHFSDNDFLVLDFETTGLNTKKDKVLSAGFTTLKKGRIKLGESAHFYIRHTDSIADETVAIHHITEQEAAQGQPIQEIFPKLLQALDNKILVAHFADIEVGFLNQIAKSLYGTALPIYVVDTLQIAFQMKYKELTHVPSNALNLFSLRAQYGLPRYKAHNAMIDAVSTAELLLVQTDELGKQATVKQLLSMS